MVTQELAATPGWKLAPLTTPLAEITGAGGGVVPPGRPETL